MSVVHHPLCPFFAVVASHVRGMVKHTRVSSDYVVHREWCHQHVKLLVKIAFPWSLGRRLTDTLERSIHSVGSSKGEQGSERGLRTTFVVLHILTADLNIAADVKGVRDEGGRVAASDQCERKRREILSLLERRAFTTIDRGQPFLFDD
jgi:hypothetical protein